MPSLLADFREWRGLLTDVRYDDASASVEAMLGWLRNEEATNSILVEIENSADANILMSRADSRQPPIAASPDEVAAIGLWLMDKCDTEGDVTDLPRKYGIIVRDGRPADDDLFARYIHAVLDRIESRLEEQEEDEIAPAGSTQVHCPLEIDRSLRAFKKDHPDERRTAFIVMQFGETDAHERIVSTIKETLGKYGIEALRADDKEYHEDLYYNVLTYLYGCSFAIAIFERLSDEVFNPNVSLEVGYMKALPKPVCLLRDSTLKELHSDLVGKLYKEFDTQDPETSIPPELEKWLRDKEIIT